MKNQVKIVAHPETGNLFTATKKDGWVKCQVQSNEMVINNGVITLQKRVAFPLVQQAVADLCLENGIKTGDSFPVNGKIIRNVTKNAQYENQQEVVNPESGETMGYFQSYEFTADMNAFDTDDRAVAQAETDVKKEEVKTVEQSMM